MNKNISIKQPQLLQIYDHDHKYYGANQIWYPNDWQKRSGCGPTTSSHLIWYLSQTRPQCRHLCQYNAIQKEDFLLLMEDLWNYVTPGPGGVNQASIFTSGAIRYGQERQVALTADILEVPSFYRGRPTTQDLIQFLTDAFSEDLPVAFLNLSNGMLKNLDSWHWVTLIAWSPDGAQMYDQNNSSVIDLKKWLKTSLMGGAFVTLKPDPE